MSNNQSKLDYDALLKDDTVQALLTHLNIATSVSQILANESILYIITATKSNEIKIKDKVFKKRARNYTTYEYLMTKNEEFHAFKDNNPFSLKEHAQKRLGLYREILTYTYGLSDVETIKENFDYLQPICEGELYKMINDIWDSWDIEPIIDSITKILNITKVKLQQHVHEKEKQEKKIDKLLEGVPEEKFNIKYSGTIKEYKDEKPEPQEGQIIINKDNEIIIR